MMNFLQDFKRKPLVGIIGLIFGIYIGVLLVASLLGLLDWLFPELELTSPTAIKMGVPASVPIVLYIAWRYIRFHDKNGYGVKWIFNNISAQLSKPIQRISFVIMLLGFLIVYLSVPFTDVWGSFDPLLSFLEHVYFEPRWILLQHSQRWNQIFSYIGTIFIIFGIFHSFLYERTVGKIYSWIGANDRA